MILFVNCPTIKIEFSRTRSKNLGSTAGSRDCQIVRGSPKDSGTKLVGKLTRNPIYGEVKIQSIVYINKRMGNPQPSFLREEGSTTVRHTTQVEYTV